MGRTAILRLLADKELGWGNSQKVDTTHIQYAVHEARAIFIPKSTDKEGMKACKSPMLAAGDLIVNPPPVAQVLLDAIERNDVMIAHEDKL
jgi:hypothetical protein